MVHLSGSEPGLRYVSMIQGEMGWRVRHAGRSDSSESSDRELVVHERSGFEPSFASQPSDVCNYEFQGQYSRPYCAEYCWFGS